MSAKWSATLDLPLPDFPVMSTTQGMSALILLTQGGGALRRAAVVGALTVPYGGAEGFTQVVTDAAVDRRQVTPGDVAFGVGSGVASSAFFSVVPEYLRVSSNAPVKSVVKKGVKSVAKNDGAVKRVAATGVEWVGNILDLAEKPGDVLAFPFKKGLGVSTITLTGSNVSTASSSKTDSKSEGKSGASSNVKTVSPTSGIVNIFAPSVPNKVPDNIPNKTDDDTDSDSDTDEDVDDKAEDKTETDTKASSQTNVPTSVAVIAPQMFWLPGFAPIGYGSKSDAKERTKFFNEQAAATRRFNQLSGLPFLGEAPKVKRNKTVMINGKEFRIGKRVKKK